MLTSKEGELEYDIKNVQIPVRTDVAKDPSYLKANPTDRSSPTWWIVGCHRSAYAEYAKISLLLLEQATEKVITKTADTGRGREVLRRRRQTDRRSRQDDHDLMAATWAEVRPTAPPGGSTPPGERSSRCAVYRSSRPWCCSSCSWRGRSCTAFTQPSPTWPSRARRDPVRRLRQLHPGVLPSRVLQLGLAHGGVHGGFGDHRPKRGGNGAGVADALGLRRRACADICVCDRRLGRPAQVVAAYLWQAVLGSDGSCKHCHRLLPPSTAELAFHHADYRRLDRHLPRGTASPCWSTPRHSRKGAVRT